MRGALLAIAVAAAVGVIERGSASAQPRSTTTRAAETGVPTSAEVSGTRDLAVSVYNDNLGVIRDRRRLSLGKGITEIRFGDVAMTLDPTSVRLTPLGSVGLEVLWQDYRFDVATADRLLERYLDQPVEVTTKDDQVRRGTLLSFDPTSLVLRESSGRVTIVTRAEVRLIALQEPDRGLVSRPTLVWRVRSPASVEQPVEVSYMASAMDWHADYAGTLSEDGGRLDLQAWASIENRSGATYENARLSLVAGTIHRATTPRPPFEPYLRSAGIAAQEKAMSVEERPFSEYHVYDVPERITLANNEVKQIGLLEASGVRSARKYTYEAQRDERQVLTTVEFTNSGSGLGVPLPEGVFRIFQKDRDQSLRLLGEDRIRHTPANDTVRVVIGTAFDITAERRQTETKQVTSRVVETAYEITLRSHKKETVEVTVVEHAYGDWEIVSSSHPARKKDATTFEFVARLAPERPVTISYRLRTRTPEPR